MNEKYIYYSYSGVVNLFISIGLMLYSITVCLCQNDICELKTWETLLKTAFALPSEHCDTAYNCWVILLISEVVSVIIRFL